MSYRTGESFVSTRNPCKLCTPFGASLAFAGVAGTIPLLHGSQGCSTYIRRYLIGHFREPVDIASTNFHESAAIFGGRDNLFTALDNLTVQYRPELIGVATTCLAETIGEDLPMLLREYRASRADRDLPELVWVSTASYRGSHADGYVAAVRALVEGLAAGEGAPRADRVNLFPGMVSPADLRWLRAAAEGFGLRPTVLPDYSDTLDGPAWGEYRRIPAGGTPLPAIAEMGTAAASVELIAPCPAPTAADWLADRFGTPVSSMTPPIGLAATDAFYEALAGIAGRDVPDGARAERGRLVDAYVDAHKYLYGRKVVLYGEQAMVVGLAGFCAEVGLVPVVCASSDRTGRLTEAVADVAPDHAGRVQCRENADFLEIQALAEAAEPDLLIGNSNGYKLARQLGRPLVRVGLPIHDRFGAARVRLLGYDGAGDLLTRIVNTFIEADQDASPVGYSHM